MAVDGEVDFGGFDRTQLEDALRRIDRTRYPLNYQRALAELARRGEGPPESLPPTTRYQFEFRGQAEEYFRIWIVNLALTVATVGIYSAWAKVRTRRYFYSNTLVAGSAFGYHAEPLRILKGRLIAAALVAAYFLSLRISFKAAVGVIIAVLLATPWLIVKSRTFSARVTSWRGLRFDFKPDYRGAYAFFLGGVIGTVFTLGLLGPRMLRERYRFIVTRTSYGSTPFDCDPSIGRFYKTAFAAGGFAMAVSIAYLILLVMLMRQVGIDIGSAQKHSAVWSFAVNLVNYALIVPVLWGYTHARNLNEVLNHTSLGRSNLRSHLRARTLIGMYFVNMLAIVASLGLLTPWALIRLARYRIESMELESADSLQSFTATSAAEVPSAASEELSSFLDLDFGF
jgi:uncharacterized membrane protein YjgN (DUF898 family)